MQVRLVDESPGNAEQLWLRIEAPQEKLTLRELIRLRVEREVERYNACLPERYHGLIEVERAERLLQGDRPGPQRPLDPVGQAERACKAFESRGFFVSVDGRPIRSLDEELLIGPASNIRFRPVTNTAGA